VDVGVGVLDGITVEVGADDWACGEACIGTGPTIENDAAAAVPGVNVGAGVEVTAPGPYW
jgi:hypothetical protein